MATSRDYYEEIPSVPPSLFKDESLKKLAEMSKVDPKACDRVAASLCQKIEINLEKEFENYCTIEELTASCDKAAKDVRDMTPTSLASPQLRNRYQNQINEGMERVKENLLNRNNAKFCELRNHCEKQKGDCVRFTEIMMKRKMNDKTKLGFDIEKCKEDTLKATEENWEAQAASCNYPTEIMEQYKREMLDDANKVLLNFGNNNASKMKDNRSKMATVQKPKTSTNQTVLNEIRRQYDAAMEEKMGGISNDKEDMDTFHAECDGMIRKFLSSKNIGVNLREGALQWWGSEGVNLYRKHVQVNADLQKRDAEECEKLKRECQSYAERLLHEEFAQQTFDEYELQQTLRGLKRKVFDKFLSECPLCALSISRTTRESLETYLENNLARIAGKRNEVQRKVTEDKAKEIEMQMKKKCKELFRTMLPDRSATEPSRIRMVRETVKNKLEDLADQKTDNSAVRKICKERIGAILEDEHQLLILNKEQEVNHQTQALKTKCLQSYKRTMEKMIDEGQNIEVSHRQAVGKVNKILSQQSSILRATVKDEIQQNIQRSKSEYISKECMKEGKEEEHKQIVKKHFRDFISQKVGGVSCSPDTLRQYILEGLFEVDKLRSKLKATFRIPTPELLEEDINEINGQNLIKNVIFHKECEARVEASVKEFKECAMQSIQQFAQNKRAFEELKEFFVKKFCQNVRGNKEIIEACRSKLRDELRPLSIGRRQNVPQHLMAEMALLHFFNDVLR